MTYNDIREAKNGNLYALSSAREMKNRRYYVGRQWTGESELPHPVFNMVKRIADYLCGAVTKEDIAYTVTDTGAVFDRCYGDARKTMAKQLTGILNSRYETEEIPSQSRELLLHACLGGTALFYTYWDNNREDGNPECKGDIAVTTLPGSVILVENPANPSLQKQKWLAILGRDKKEAVAKLLGVTEGTRDYGKLVPDGEGEEGTLPYAKVFYREDGVVFSRILTEALTGEAVSLGLSLYPFAQFNWESELGNFYGTTPMTSILPNQDFVNVAYAMAMKHMRDTAFSKVLYDKSRISSWDNGIGEAVAVTGGGCVEDAVKIVGVGELQEGYLDLIQSVMDNTKRMLGAVDVALGDAEATNTSAILALQTAGEISQSTLREALRRTLTDLAQVWLDMLKAGYFASRPLSNGEDAILLDGELLKMGSYRVTAQFKEA